MSDDELLSYIRTEEEIVAISSSHDQVDDDEGNVNASSHENNKAT